MINKSLINKMKYYLLILLVVIQPILDIHYLIGLPPLNTPIYPPSQALRRIDKMYIA